MGHTKEEANNDYSNASREVNLFFRKRRVNQHLCVQSLDFACTDWYLLGSTTVIMLPTIPTYGGTCLPIDSYIQHIFLVVVVVVFTLKTVLTSIQYPSLSYSSRQRNEFPWSHANPK